MVTALVVLVVVVLVLQAVTLYRVWTFKIPEPKVVTVTAPAPAVAAAPSSPPPAEHKVDIEALRVEMEQDPTNQGYRKHGQNYEQIAKIINIQRASHLGFVGVKDSDVQQIW